MVQCGLKFYCKYTPTTPCNIDVEYADAIMRFDLYHVEHTLDTF
jgi:hypothetical protein